MREKPALQDKKIIGYLSDHYGLDVTDIVFLPLGNDSAASVYRVVTKDGATYFLKVKHGFVPEISLHIPRYLKDQRINPVVAPLRTHDQRLFGTIEPFTLILYPYVAGDVGMAVGLSAEQWVMFGTIVQQFHGVNLPPSLLVNIRKEDFVLPPEWWEIAHHLQNAIQTNTYNNPFERQLAAFWQARHAEISTILLQAKELGRILQNRTLDFVLCHADIHTANLLLSDHGDLFVVDWDQPILAPKERDLMFVVEDATGGSVVEGKPETLFFKGYGEVTIDPLVLAYYRYEWVVQEIGDYGERVFLMEDASDALKEESTNGFIELFNPGDVVDAAYHSLRALS
jgi:spectinomycin phosphotransferase